MTRLQVSKSQAQIVIGLLALAAVLLYNWTHTGGLLAGYVRPDFIGYIAAAGIELAIVGLSLRIADLRKQNIDARFFVFTLAAVVIVSALANVSEGFAVKFSEPLTLANVGRLDIVQAVVSLAATGLLSLVTFALAEIVGGDVTAAAKVASKPGKVTSGAGVTVSAVTPDVSNTEGVTPFPMPIEQTRAVKGDTDAAAKAAAIDTLIGHLTSHPDATVTQLAKLIGRSRPTVYNYLDELEAAGRLHRNGQITVLDAAQG
jgi:hypothetical protein